MTVLPYALLAVVTALTAIIERDDPGRLAVIVALSVVTAAWMLWMRTLHPQWRCRPRLMALYFVVLVALMAALVLLAPWYGFFTWTGYFSVELLAGRQRIAGVVAIALVTATSQNGGVPGTADAGSLPIWIVIACINLGAAGAIMWFALLGERRNAERERAITELTELNRKLEASLAENAGLHRQLLAQAREAGVLDERQRMARELHDTLAQGLTGIITQLEAAEHAGDAVPERRRHLAAAQRVARDSLTEARRALQAMRPEALDRARLPEALADVAGRWTELTGVAAEVTTTGDPRPMRPEIEVALLRTAQEALANVERHAAASRVGLTLSYMGDLVTLDVRDDGVGFVPMPPNGNGGGFGLVAMRQRVQGLAGTLEIESEPGGGTAVSVSVPAIPSGA